MTYSHWSPDQGPNQSGFFFSDGGHEDCALMKINDEFRWHDYECSLIFYHYSFICQYGKSINNSAISRKIWCKKNICQNSLELMNAYFLLIVGNISLQNLFKTVIIEFHKRNYYTDSFYLLSTNTLYTCRLQWVVIYSAKPPVWDCYFILDQIWIP